MQEISLQKLLETGAHFGHQFKRWNPKMEIYMHANKEGVYVFDLIKTRDSLKEALEAIKKASSEGKNILFVGTKKQVKDLVKNTAEDLGYPYVTERWLGGTLTNFEQVQRSISKLPELEEKVANARQRGYTKKERVLMERDIEKLKRVFGGIINLKEIPGMVIVVDTKREGGAVSEATKSGCETVGIVDSNADPNLVDWIIPMNDDAAGAIEYVLELIKEAVEEGKGKKPSKVKKAKTKKNDKKDNS